MAHKTINDIVKEYPEMLKIIIYHEGYTLPDKSKKIERAKIIKQQNKQDSIDRSVRRTKTTITDLIICNQFELWCTFTFDKKKLNRYDINKCKTTMSMWLHNQRKHSPNMEYLLVPEYHKDGAIHFHALIKNYNGRLRQTYARTKTGRSVYTCSSYGSGFSWFVPIANYQVKNPLKPNRTNIGLNNKKTSNKHTPVQLGDTLIKQSIQDEHGIIGQYMQKYITKDMPLIDGRKRYWTSQGLRRPTTHINGIFSLNLSKLVYKHKYSYANDSFELQIHRKLDTPIDRDLRLVKLL